MRRRFARAAPSAPSVILRCCEGRGLARDSFWLSGDRGWRHASPNVGRIFASDLCLEDITRVVAEEEGSLSCSLVVAWCTVR